MSSYRGNEEDPKEQRLKAAPL